MPKLKTMYEKAEEIPEGYGELYAEKNGKFELTGIEGVKTQGDVDRLDQALKNERAEAKVIKDKLSKFTTLGPDFDPEQVAVLQEQLAESNARLESITKEGKLDETKLTERINTAVASAVGPVQRTLDATKRSLEAEQKKVVEAKAAATALENSIKRDRMRTTIREGAAGSGIVPTAIEDAVLVGEGMFEMKDDGTLLTKVGVDGITPGLSPKEWYKEMQEKRPHWYPASVGGGSGGGRGPGGVPYGKENPWTAEGWNLTEQGKFLRKEGQEKAAAAAARAGSALGALRPPAQKG